MRISIDLSGDDLELRHIMVHAAHLMSAIDEFDNELRSLLKYTPDQVVAKPIETLERLRETFIETIKVPAGAG